MPLLRGDIALAATALKAFMKRLEPVGAEWQRVIDIAMLTNCPAHGRAFYLPDRRSGEVILAGNVTKPYYVGNVTKDGRHGTYPCPETGSLPQAT
jgi:hypothetical protein